MIVKDFFEQIFFPNVKDYVEKTSNYAPKVTKKKPQESKIFPIVPIRLLDVVNKYNNLSYGEETYTFGIEINVYATDKDQSSKRTICDEVTKILEEYIKKNYRFKIKINWDVPNADSTIHRNTIMLTGKLDTKYKDKLYIYPR